MPNPFDTVPVNTLQALLMQGRGADDAFQNQMRPLQLQEARGKIAARDQLSQMLAGGGTPDYGRMALGMLAAGDPTGAGVLANLTNQQAERGYKERQLNILEQNASRKDIPSGFERDPGTGGLKPISGGPADPAYKREAGDRQNAPPGYRWRDPGNPEAGLTAIPGGPAEKIDAEVAGRLGLAKSFLGQLPRIRERVKAGELTGPIDAAFGAAGARVPDWMGGGDPGELRRQIDSGAESLLRMLTGAGMNKEEAANYVRRYQFSTTDSAETALSKLSQLERELNSVIETVSKGRGGAGDHQQSGAASPSADVQPQNQQPVRVSSPDEARRLPRGTPIILPDGTPGRVP